MKRKSKETPPLAETVKGNQPQWRVNTPGLLREILNNNGVQILTKPLQIFGSILAEVGERAAELNDPKLNALMCRLAIYEIADPCHENYNRKLTESIIDGAIDECRHEFNYKIKFDHTAVAVCSKCKKEVPA